MKRLSFILAALLLLSGVSSCDFFRGLAGRPLSSDIEAKRARIELAQKRAEAFRDSLERARKDSVLRVQQFLADSTYAADSLLKAGVRAGVIWQDGRVFLGPCHIRMNLALPTSRVKEAFDRLDRYVFNGEW